MIAPRKNTDGANMPVNMIDARICHEVSPSISSELTATSQGLHHQPDPSSTAIDIMPTRLAGVVGVFTGCGALLALGLFLRLPDIIQRRGTSPGEALADSYYIVGASSLVLALLCFLGLRNLHGEDKKGWRNLVYGGPDDLPSKSSSLRSVVDAVALGFKDPSLGLGYIGGFVARASVRLFEVITSFATDCPLGVHVFNYKTHAIPWTRLENLHSCFWYERNADPKMCSRLRSRFSFLFS